MGSVLPILRRVAPFLLLAGVALLPPWTGTILLQSMEGLARRLWIGSLLVALIHLPSVAGFLQRIARSSTGPMNRIFRFPGTIFFALLAGVFFYSFRLRLFLPPPEGLGDSLHLIEYIPVYTELFGYLGSFDEVLELFLHSRLYALLTPFLERPVEAAYTLTGVSAGMAWVLLVSRRARKDGASLPFFFSFLFLPGMALFAGYVESYTLPALFLGLVLHAGVAFLEKKGNGNTPSRMETKSQSNDPARSRVSPGEILFFTGMGALSAFAAALHMIAVFLGPALIYLVFARSGADRKAFLIRGIPAVLAAGLVLGSVWSYFLFFAATPLSPGTSFAFRPALYPAGKILSPVHLFQYISLLVFAAPGALAWWIGSGRRERTQGKILGSDPSPGFSAEGLDDSRISRGRLTLRTIRRIHRESPHLVFAWIAAGVFSIHAFLWNPMIGFPADWDLFTLFQVPLNLAVYLTLIRPGVMRNQESFREGFLTRLSATLFALVLGFTWIQRNARRTPESELQLQRSRQKVEAFLSAIHRDPVYTKIPSVEKRQSYVEAMLFATGARALLDRNDPGDRALQNRLEKAVLELRKVLGESRTGPANQKGKKEEGFRKVWEEFTEINREMSGR